MAGEGEVYLACGVEVMSRIPYSIDGSRAAKALRSLDTVKAKWGELLTTPGSLMYNSPPDQATPREP